MPPGDSHGLLVAPRQRALQPLDQLVPGEALDQRTRLAGRGGAVRVLVDQPLQRQHQALPVAETRQAHQRARMLLRQLEAAGATVELK